MAFRGDSTDTYTYVSGSTGGTVDLGARNNYRYINASNVYNKGKSDGTTTHTTTYTFPSNDTGGTKDLGVNHSYRYVNATNVYNKGKSDGQNVLPNRMAFHGHANTTNVDPTSFNAVKVGDMVTFYPQIGLPIYEGYTDAYTEGAYAQCWAMISGLQYISNVTIGSSERVVLAKITASTFQLRAWGQYHPVYDIIEYVR